MEKKLFKCFCALTVMIMMMLTASSVLLTSCTKEDQSEINGNINGNGNDKPVPPTNPDWYLSDAFRKSCVFVKDSTHTNTPEDNAVTMQGLKTFDLEVEGTWVDKKDANRDSVGSFHKLYNIELGAKISNHRSVVKKFVEVLPDSVEMKEGKLSICQSEMPVTIAPVSDVELSVFGGLNGQTEFKFSTKNGNKDYQLETSQITRVYLLINKKPKTRAAYTEKIVPAELHCVCEHGEDLVYNYQLSVLEEGEERTDITAEFVDLTEDGYVKYDIIKTKYPENKTEHYPGMAPVSAELTAKSIDSSIQEAPGISLTSDSELKYYEPKEYTFGFNKFKSLVYASYTNTVEVEFEGETYQIEIPGSAFVKFAGIVNPTIDSEKDKDYILYTYKLGYNLTWKNNAVARPFKYSDTSFTEKIKKNSDQTITTIEFVDFTEDGYIKYNIVKTTFPDEKVTKYPGKEAVNARLVAKAIASEVQETPGISLTSASEQDYTAVQDYIFKFNKFESPVNAMYINSITVEFENKNYTLNIPGKVLVKMADIGKPAIDETSDKDYILYTYPLTYNLAWNYKDVVRSFKKAETSYTEKIKKVKEETKIEVEFVDLTEDGYIKYNIIKTVLPDGKPVKTPGMTPAPAELTAKSIASTIEKTAGINLTSAAELTYEKPQDYTFIFNKFNSLVFASSLNSVDVEYEGNTYKVTIPGGFAVKFAGASDPVTDAMGFEDYVSYTYTLTYKLLWKNGDIVRPFKTSSTSFTEKVAKDKEQTITTVEFVDLTSDGYVKYDMVKTLYPAGIATRYPGMKPIDAALTAKAIASSIQKTAGISLTSASEQNYSQNQDYIFSFDKFQSPVNANYVNSIDIDFENEKYTLMIPGDVLIRLSNIGQGIEDSNSDKDYTLYTYQLDYNLVWKHNKIDRPFKSSSTSFTEKIEKVHQQTVITTEFVDLTSDGYVKYNIIKTVLPDGKPISTPGMKPVNAALTAKAIASSVQKTAGISLTSASEQTYSNAGDYTFTFNKFNSPVEAAYVNSIDVMYEGETYQIEIPGSVSVKQAHIGTPVTDDKSDDDYTLYTYQLDYNLVWKHNNLNRPFKSSSTSFTEKIAKDKDKVEKIELTLTDNGNNTGTLKLIEYHSVQENVTLSTDIVPLGYTISCTPSYSVNNANLALTGGSIGAITDWQTTSGDYNQNGITANRIQKSLVSSFNHGTDRKIVISQYDAFAKVYNGSTYKADVTRLNVGTANINENKALYVDDNAKTQKVYDVTYTAKGTLSSVSADQRWTITYEKPNTIINRFIGNEVITLEGGNYFRNISVTPVYSISGNGNPYQARINTRFSVSDNGTVKVYGNMGSLTQSSETTANASTIQNDSVSGYRTKTTSVYSVNTQKPTLSIQIDGVANFYGTQLKTLIPSTTAVLNKTGETFKSGLYTVEVYNIVYTITVDGKSVNHSQRLENYIINIDPTIPGLEVDPAYYTSFARTDVYNTNRSSHSVVDAGIFREIANPGVKHFCAFDANGTVLVNMIIDESKLGLIAQKSGYCSLLRLDDQQPAVLYGRLTSNEYKSGFEYKSITTGSINTFSNATITIEGYTCPLYSTLVKQEGYYQMGGDKIYR